MGSYAHGVCLDTFNMSISKLWTDCVPKFSFREISSNLFPNLAGLVIICEAAILSTPGPQVLHGLESMFRGIVRYYKPTSF